MRPLSAERSRKEEVRPAAGYCKVTFLVPTTGVYWADDRLVPIRWFLMDWFKIPFRGRAEQVIKLRVGDVRKHERFHWGRLVFHKPRHSPCRLLSHPGVRLATGRAVPPAAPVCRCFLWFRRQWSVAVTWPWVPQPFAALCGEPQCFSHPSVYSYKPLV